MALPIFPHLAKPVKLIVLDRDGVINEDSDEYVKSVEEWIPIPGSLEAIARLCKAGWTVAVATNQSGVARGKFDLSTLGDMHFKMQQLVMGQGGRIDLIVHCPTARTMVANAASPSPGCFAPSPSTSAWPISRAFRWWATAIAICMPACCWVASPTWSGPARACALWKVRCRRVRRYSMTWPP